MVERLAQLGAAAAARPNEFANDLRARHLRSLEPPTDPRRRVAFDLQLGAELLRAGSTEEAVGMLQDVWTRLSQAPEWRDSPVGIQAHSLLAIAHMRLGEQINCVQHHNANSCILPIRGDGIHVDQRGSREAIRELVAALERNPTDLRARWLLNVAAMTVGDYPTKVPERWLVPPTAFESDYDIGRFPNVASGIGLDVVGLAGGALLEDFDGDRHLDLMVTSMGMLDQVRYFRNNRDGTFVEQTDAAGLKGIVGGLNAVHADYDNDGDMDVFIPRGAWLGAEGLMPPSLLRNRGTGVFDDVTESAGLLAFYPSQTAAWGDFDNDGWLDLFVAPESSGPAGSHPAKLYRNDHKGGFADVAAEAGVDAVGFFKGSNWGDYNNDGRLDLYVTGIHKPAANRLFRNDGPDPQTGRWTFTDVAAAAGVSGPWSSFPTWFFDYDNDGWLDIFVSGYAGGVEDVAADYLGTAAKAEGELPRLYRNQRDGTFRDVATATGLDTVLMTMGCNYGDLDNDGWLDFYAATGDPDYRTLVPNRMFRNERGARFQDVTTSGGFGHLQKGHGVAFGDIDLDGDQDVFLKVGGAYTGDTFQSAVFENPGHGNSWIGLSLVGDKSNRAAIGARLALTVVEPSGPRTIYDTVSTGSSFGGSPVRRHIGLGKARRVERLEIYWPVTGSTQVFENLPAGRSFEIHEGRPEARPIELKAVKLRRQGHSHH
jgi:hypothetical protein